MTDAVVNEGNRHADIYESNRPEDALEMFLDEMGHRGRDKHHENLFFFTWC